MANKINSIEVIGSGCANCKKMRELAIKAAQELELGIEVAYSDDVQKGLKMGVMQFPVLAVNGKAVLAGPVADFGKIKKAIKEGTSESGCQCSCGDCGC